MTLKSVLSAVMCAISVFSIAGCSSDKNANESSGAGDVQAEYKITIEQVESEDFEILGNVVRKYLETPYSQSLPLVQSPKSDGEDSQMAFISFKSEYKKSFTVRYSENSDFSEYKEIVYKPQKSVRRYNVNLGILVPDTRYYAFIYATDDPEFKSEVIEFETEDCGVRLINLIDENGKGPRNVRDIGGYSGLDGKRIKYGMIYRGGYLNRRYGADDSYALTDYGRNIMAKALGIKGEIDLRTSGSDDIDTRAEEKLPQTKNQINENDPYYKFTITQYDLIFNHSGSQKNITNIFQTLAKEESYPLYLHCNAGADRTGTICALIECLLGVSEEDATKDFELTSFSPFGKRTRVYVQQNDSGNYIAWGKFLETLRSFDDSENRNLTTATEKYLLSLGVTRSEINSIRSILLETHE